MCKARDVPLSEVGAGGDTMSRSPDITPSKALFISLKKSPIRPLWATGEAAAPLARKAAPTKITKDEETMSTKKRWKLRMKIFAEASAFVCGPLESLRPI